MGFSETPAFEQHPSVVQPSVSRLTRLLAASPVDLARVGGEIHAQPELEAMVMTLSKSLILSPDGPVGTLEEAAVVLGTDRLRVVDYMWSLMPHARESDAFPAQAPAMSGVVGDIRDNSAPVSAEWTPETIYLASFLRWLGLDSPGLAISGNHAPCFASGLQGGELSVLTDILMRDFVSLIPILDPAILMPRRKSAPANAPPL